MISEDREVLGEVMQIRRVQGDPGDADCGQRTF